MIYIIFLQFIQITYWIHWSYTSHRSQHFQPISFGGFSEHIKDISAARNLVRSAAFQQRYLGSRKIHTPHEGWDVQILSSSPTWGVSGVCVILQHKLFGWTSWRKSRCWIFRFYTAEGIFHHIDARRSVWWCDRPRHRSCGFCTTCGPSGPLLPIFVVCETVKHPNVSTLQATRLNRFIRMVTQPQWHHDVAAKRVKKVGALIWGPGHGDAAEDVRRFATEVPMVCSVSLWWERWSN